MVFRLRTEEEDGSKPSLIEDGVVEVARRIAGVAAFIQHQYCRGVLMEAVLFHGFMTGLRNRLINYDWPLLKDSKAFHSWEDPVPEPQEAVNAMKTLKDFFYQRAYKAWENGGPPAQLSEDNILSGHLTFAAEFTENLIEAKARWSDREGEEMLEKNLRQASALRIAREALKEPRENMWDLSEAVQRAANKEFEGARTPPETLGCAPPVTETATQSTEAESALPATETKTQSSDLVPADVLEANKKQAIALRAAHDAADKPLLRPWELSVEIQQAAERAPAKSSNHIHQHAPYRLSGRSWFEKDAHFADLVGEPRPWSHPPAETFMDIRGGHERACWHFIDATSLGLSGLETTKVRHPLDRFATRDLDWDILRFLRLTLWDWTNGHPYREEEIASLKAVREEIKLRKEETKRVEENGETAASVDATCDPTPSTAPDTETATGPYVAAEAAKLQDIPVDENSALHFEEKEPKDGFHRYVVTVVRDKDSLEPSPEVPGEVPGEVDDNDSVICYADTIQETSEELYEQAQPPSFLDPYSNGNLIWHDHSAGDTRYDDPNAHVHGAPDCTPSSAYLMSLSNVYNPTKPVETEPEDDEDEEVYFLVPVTPKKKSMSPGRCRYFQQVKQKFGFGKKGKQPLATETDGYHVSKGLIRRDSDISGRRLSDELYETSTNGSRARRPSSAASNGSNLSNSAWLGTLNTTKQHRRPESPENALRTSRGRQRLEALPDRVQLAANCERILLDEECESLRTPTWEHAAADEEEPNVASDERDLGPRAVKWEHVHVATDEDELTRNLADLKEEMNLDFDLDQFPVERIGDMTVREV